MRKRNWIVPVKGVQPITDKLDEIGIKKKRRRIDKAQVDIDKCLSCTKEKCKGNCELMSRI
jgi:hypothetical protein